MEGDNAPVAHADDVAAVQDAIDLNDSREEGGHGDDLLQDAIDLNADSRERAVDGSPAKRPRAQDAIDLNAGSRDGREGRWGDDLPAKRSRKARAPDYWYEPKELTDFTIKTKEGKIVACHRAFVLRYSKLVGTMLEAMPSAQLPVTESAEEIRTYFLNPIYDRSVAIKSSTVLRVLDMADKYEAPLLVQACKDALLAPEFELTVHDGSERGERGFDALEALALATKHRFRELADKALEFLAAKAADDCEQTAMYVQSNAHVLGGLEKADALAVLQSIAKGTSAGAKGLKLKAHQADESEAAAKKELKDARADVQRHKKIYSSLLSKYNKLISKARNAGVAVP